MQRTMKPCTILLAILVASTVHSSEIELPTVGISKPLITVVPNRNENPSAKSYCRLDGDRLVVEIENFGEIAVSDVGWVEVSYETSHRPIVRRKFLYWLDAGDVAGLFFPVPPQCLNPDCDFAIRLPNRLPVVGRCTREQFAFAESPPSPRAIPPL